MNYIQELQDVIRQLHGSESTHVETVPVVETHQGQTVWQGEVEVFDLHDHPKAPRVYAWTHDTEDADKPRRSVTVLHIPPATSPRKAVQVAIAGELRERLASEADN
jgi:hypothetical protein